MRRKKTTLFNVICNQPYDCNSRMKLYCSSKASVQLIQRMSLLKRLGVHNGCVNSICWNSTGDLILSGSDDQHLVLTNIYNYKVLTDYKTSHRANIFSAKFLPNNGDHRIVSCSGDGIILYTDLLRTSETFHNQFSCHNGTAYEIETMPGEPHSFLSCGEDCTVRYFDLRVKSSCNTPRCKEDVLIFRQRAITAMSVNPMMPHYLAIGCADSSVGIYDRRMLSIDCSGVNSDTSTRAISMFTVPEFEGHPYRISSLNYSPDGNDILVSYSSDHIYLFSAKDQGSMRLKKEAAVEKNKNKRPPVRSPQPVRRLRLRGDWSDTGPDARPEREGGRRNGAEIAQARPVLHTSLMQRMTDVLSRMLNDPATRAALSGGGEDSIQGVIAEVQQGGDNNVDRATEEQAMETEASHQQVQENENAESNITEDHALGTFEPAFSVIDHDGGSVNNASIDCAEDNATAAQEETACPDESSQFEEAIHLPMSPSVSCEKNDREMADSGSDTPPNIENVRDDSMMENLQDRLTSMRDGFLERHGSEPAVSLTYSDKSSTGATISLGVANEVIRDSYHPGPSGSQTLSKSSASTNSNVSHNHKIGYSEICENVDDEVYSDSDDEEMLPNRRVEKPLDTEMEETMLTNKQVPFSHSESFTTNPFTDLHVRQKYMGHRNARTMIKEANFWGNDFVMSGSDCGHVFVWDRETAKLCMLLEADQHVVNCIQPHPYLPILATSGIDYDVKLWAPINEEANFDVNFAEDLQKRNAVMLEETKDTITVPAVFMIRMLACLNQIRRGRGRNRRRSGDEGDELRGG